VPLVGATVVDRHFGSKGLGPPAFDWAALPVVATQSGALEALTADQAGQLGERLAWSRGHHATRAVVQAAAAATSPRPVISLSAPSLTPTRLAAFLDELSAPALMKLIDLASNGWLRSDDPAALPLFPRGTLDRLVLLVTSSQPAWEFDIEQRTARTRRAMEEEAT
jgi:hypothetical protein